MPGGPAKVSGMVQENDVLLKVGGKDVTGEKLENVNKLLCGAAGSKVRIKLSRSGMQFDTTLVRAEDAAPQKKPAPPPKKAAATEPAGKRKLTDREKADRMLNGGVKYRGGDHNTHMRKASDAEAARINAAEAGRHAAAQKGADALYDDNVRRDQEALEASKAEKQGQGWTLAGLFGSGGTEPGKENKRPLSGGGLGAFSMASLNPLAAHAGGGGRQEQAAKKSKLAGAHNGAGNAGQQASWNPFAPRQPAPSQPAATSWGGLNPFGKKTPAPKPWHQRLSDDLAKKTQEIKVAAADAYIHHKVNKTKGQLFGAGAKAENDRATGICGACCARPRGK